MAAERLSGPVQPLHGVGGGGPYSGVLRVGDAL